jgi:peptidoglycan/xylan/chitin deacetylase (PgdA/CDA1 family)
LFKKYEIKTTWFTPTHTMETFPALFNAVMEHGHEIGAHGCLHERIDGLEEAAERALLTRQVTSRRLVRTIERHCRGVARLIRPS